MTEVEKLSGATSSLGKYWKSMNWNKVHAGIKRLQMRIAKAVREGKDNKVKSLQWLLSHSFSAKLLAVKRVTSNKGARSAGIDGILWDTPARKMRGALSLKRKGYKALPLRRIEIPKRNGKIRPLGIPTIRDRVMQALYLLTLEPIAETEADHNSYGFRMYRACRDAIGQCFCALAKSYSPKWILEADITACFDGINHDWILNNIPLDKKILLQWLKCGYIQNKKLFATQAGTPQGGIISPTLANLTLDGLESTVKKACPSRRKVNFVRYADDFIVTADTKELIEEKIIPAINEFLKPRGLSLSAEKTKIVHIDQGFDFLGQHLQKYRNKLIITPAQRNVKDFLGKVKDKIKNSRGWKAGDMIIALKPIIKGWSEYHKCIQASKAFSRADNVIFNSLWRWARKRHSGKNCGWIKKQYFNHPKYKWVFSCWSKAKTGEKKLMELPRVSYTKLVRYIKIKGEANPFNPEYAGYFYMRRVSSNTCAI